MSRPGDPLRLRGGPRPISEGAAPAVRPLAVLLLGLLPVALACGGPDADGDDVVPTAGDLTGCWSLEIGDAEGVYRPASRPGLPATVRLDTTRLDRVSPVVRRPTYRAWSITGRTIRDLPFHGWRTIEGDSLWAGHPGGYAGYELRLALAADTLVGRLESAPDVRRGRGLGPGPARLVRTSCPDLDAAIGG